jgi:uncharacterized protein (TIGR01777 family)
MVSMRILIAGSTGFLGERLVRHLRDSGHDVSRLVRRDPKDANEFRWDPAAGTLDRSTVEGADAVINLAGATVARPRTEAYKQNLLDIRLDTSRTLATTIAALPGNRPDIWLNASGVDAYGDTGDQPTDESRPLAHGFLADMCRAWEGATAPASDKGVRVAYLRTGFPLSKDGGFLKPQILQFKLLAGGRLGSGRQYIPWIGMPDWLGADEHVLRHDDIAGPVNMVGPDPVRNVDFAKALAKALHRPALIPAPGFALKLVLGELGQALLESKRVVPGVLTTSGYQFKYRTIDAALQQALNTPDRR